ncbi:hypothetical protein [uncultured Pedobacter sp.]|uniref:hypothetical protein n=1 Tax=uncultured Pedobacter sp. TaxID=246139 RepID=UPI0025F977CC|nr:hypothetical protein [uncultured Pedobacter sp.]
MKNIILTEKQAINDATTTIVDHAPLLEQEGLEYALDNHYLICGGGQQSGDRKLYLSVVISHLPAMLKPLIPELVDMGLGFGMVKDQSSARLVLNGYLGAEHVGKVVIVFVPQDRADMVRKIAIITQGFFGPIVPDKVQISSCVFIDPAEDNDCFFIDREITRKEHNSQNDNHIISNQDLIGSKKGWHFLNSCVQY